MELQQNRVSGADIAIPYTLWALIIGNKRDAAAWRVLAVYLASHGEWREALDATEQALLLDPDDVEAIRIGAAAMILGNEIESARESLLLASRVEADERTELALGLVAEILGDVSEASAYYAKCGGEVHKELCRVRMHYDAKITAVVCLLGGEPEHYACSALWMSPSPSECSH